MKKLDCKYCGNSFDSNNNKIFCSKKCQRDNYKLLGIGKEPFLNDLSTATKGTVSELIVAADLIKKGYSVFRALSAHSDCDLLAEKSGIMLRIEVRTGSYLYTGQLSYPKNRLEGKFVIVFTFKDNKIHYLNPLPL